MTTWQKIGVLFGLPETATEKEIDAEADSRLRAINDAADEGEAAGAEESTEAEATTEAPEANASDNTPTLSAEDIAKIVAKEVKAGIAPLNDRLAKVEGSDAAEETGGPTEIADANTGAPLYRQNPTTKRAAASLKGK